MNVVKISVSDLKGVRWIAIRPKKVMTGVGGQNAAGKSSFFDAIGMTLGGKALCPDRPIRDGQDKGFCEIELDGDPERLFPPCTVRRDFWRKANGQIESKLEIVTKEGYRAPSPQTLLGDIVGPLGFDPESFLRMKGKEQADILRSLVGLDFTELDREYQEIYRERTKVNEQGKKLKVQFDAMPQHDVPEEEVSVAELIGKMRARKATNAANAKQRKELESLKDKRVEEYASKLKLTEEIVKVEQMLAGLKERLSDHEARVEEITKLANDKQAEVEALVDADLSEVEQQIADSEQVNKQIRENAAKDKAGELLKVERSKSALLTERLKKIEASKDELRQNAKWPVEGLGYDDTGVTFNSLPFAQISASEQRRVAISIACALQPSLKFFFIKDGSLLDDEAKAEVAEIAAEYGCQVFLEVVGKDSAAHMIIEDGEVAWAEEGMIVEQPEELKEEPNL